LADYELPVECWYSQEDEWVREEGDRVFVGITDYAQQQLGDIVFVELPEVGDTVSASDSFGVIESVKAVSDLYAPVSGRIVDVNGALTDRPEMVNEDCYGEGWIIAIEGVDESELDSLMDARAYLEFIEQRAE
jgi:glycine cleavage system H protein